MARCLDCSKRLWPGQGQIVWWISKRSPLCASCYEAAQASRQALLRMEGTGGLHSTSHLRQPAVNEVFG